MDRSARHSSGLVLLALLLLLFSVATVGAQEQSLSAPLAKQLTTLLESAKLDSVAAREASSADTYVAALYFPGQLMVVSAKYSVPVLMNQKLEKKDYKDVYIDLNSACIANTKILVMDLGADGLKATRDEGKPFDTYETSAKPLAFDGDWKAQRLTEAEYMKAFAAADAQYARMLQALIAQLKKSGA
jgi:hypothetical protein